MTLTLGVLRTFRSLQFWHQKLMEDAGQSRNPEDFIKKNQKNYMNVVNESMLIAHWGSRYSDPLYHSPAGIASFDGLGELGPGLFVQAGGQG